MMPTCFHAVVSAFFIAMALHLAYISSSDQGMSVTLLLGSFFLMVAFVGRVRRTSSGGEDAE